MAAIGALPMANAAPLQPAVLFDERHDLVVGRREVGAAVAGDDDGATGVAQARRFVPVPAVDITIEKARGEGVTRAQDVVDLDWKTGRIDRRLAAFRQMYA